MLLSVVSDSAPRDLQDREAVLAVSMRDHKETVRLSRQEEREASDTQRSVVSRQEDWSLSIALGVAVLSLYPCVLLRMSLWSLCIQSISTWRVYDGCTRTKAAMRRRTARCLSDKGGYACM
jgi:hypothetical protein